MFWKVYSQSLEPKNKRKFTSTPRFLGVVLIDSFLWLQFMTELYFWQLDFVHIHYALNQYQQKYISWVRRRCQTTPTIATELKEKTTLVSFKSQDQHSEKTSFIANSVRLHGNTDEDGFNQFVWHNVKL
jgi:hypothetical protein